VRQSPYIALALVALALALAGCESDGGGNSHVLGGGRLPKNGTLFMKVYNQDASKTGPADVQVKLNGEKIVDRAFSMGADSYDGQYQIRLPQGRHTIEASTPQGATFTSRAVNLKDTAFVQIYVTEDSKVRLTPGSQRSLARLVIKRMHAASGVNSDPALWMIIPAPKPAPATIDTAIKNFATKPQAKPQGKPSANTNAGGKP